METVIVMMKQTIKNVTMMVETAVDLFIPNTVLNAFAIKKEHVLLVLFHLKLETVIAMMTLTMQNVALMVVTVA